MENSLERTAGEDSGYVGSMLASTPVTELATRKRKLSAQLLPHSAAVSPFAFASSTLNDSQIAQSFEKCNISSFTPNYYLERSSVVAEKKPRSEPMTPTKESAFYKFHNESHQKTPTKLASLQKLGSPERNQILYGDIRPNSIKKLTTTCLKRSSPAKKRLFNEFGYSRTRSLIAIRIDPVTFFTIKRSNANILDKIMSHLSPADLCRFRHVNRDWNFALSTNRDASNRVAAHLKLINFNKENQTKIHKNTHEVVCAPIEAAVTCPFIKVANTLKEGQTLAKCPQCNQVSIVEKNIGQCQHYMCGYIFCKMCDSFSTTGPENFRDKCMQSSLLVEKPRRRPRLTDSPGKTSEQLPSFLMDATNSYYYESSGYATDADASPLHHQHERRRASILSDRNEIVPECRSGGRSRRSSFAPVVPMATAAPVRLIEVMEPSSPPKIRNVACSSSSRKNLKRLIR